MMTKISGIAFVLFAASVIAGNARAGDSLAIGDTLTLESKVLKETRRINVFTPTYYGQPFDEPLPVLYMPDGGINEDFLHVAGLVQILSANGGMRPFLLVGIENTERRRDLTGPTEYPEDRKIARRVGGSAAFRAFIRDELMPEIRARYAVTDETAIVGESLAGLFIVETFLLEPGLFDTYIALDPSLWWNRRQLVNNAATYLDGETQPARTLFLATSNEKVITGPVQAFAAALREHPVDGLAWHYEAMPEETHASIYHPAALRAFREVLAPRR